LCGEVFDDINSRTLREFSQTAGQIRGNRAAQIREITRTGNLAKSGIPIAEVSGSKFGEGGGFKLWELVKFVRPFEILNFERDQKQLHFFKS
jgi:hypothetical protein